MLFNVVDESLTLSMFVYRLYIKLIYIFIYTVIDGIVIYMSLASNSTKLYEQ